MPTEDPKMDLRLIDRYRRAGVLTDDEVAAYRKKLPDMKEESEPVRLGPGEAPAAETKKE